MFEFLDYLQSSPIFDALLAKLFMRIRMACENIAENHYKKNIAEFSY
jgi:hypothetical protein